MSSSLHPPHTHQQQELSKLPGNRRCCDCSEKLPQYVNLTFHTFICTGALVSSCLECPLWLMGEGGSGLTHQVVSGSSSW